MRYTFSFVLGLLVVAGLVSSSFSADSPAARPDRQDRHPKTDCLPPVPPPRPQIPAPPPRPGGFPIAEGVKIASEQRTRVQVEVYELDCPIEKLQSLDLDKLAAIPSVEVTKQLKEQGVGGLKYRLDIPIQLGYSKEALVKCGANMPTVQSVSMSSKGDVTPSVSYKDTGVMLEIRGAWLDEGDMADVHLLLEWNSVASSRVEIASDIKLPQFEQYMYRQSVKAKSGEHLMFLVSHGTTQSDEKTHTRVGIVRLVLTHMMD